MRYDKDKLRESLSVEDVHRILIDLGSNPSKEDNQGNLMFQTICHGGSSHKLYYYSESKSFHCYTHCSETFDIYELAVKVKKISFPQAVQYVAKIAGKTFGFGTVVERDNNDLIDDWDYLNRFQKKEKKIIELPEYDNKVLDVFLPYPHELWLNENISYETQKKFEIGYYIREERIVIPHRDTNGRLVGLRGRSTRQEDIDNGKKYMPLVVGGEMYNHQTMLNLFGIHKTESAVRRLKKIVLFEGEKSVLKVEDFYGENNFSCAVCSSQITNYQRDIILSLGVEEVFIAFDKFRAREENESEEMYEKRIEDYQKRLLKFAHKFTAYCKVYIIWDDFDLLQPKDSPCDRGKEILEQLMKAKYEIKTMNEVEN